MVADAGATHRLLRAQLRALLGGVPDRRDLADYAKRKGFIVTVLTNGLRLSSGLIDYFTKYPPLSVDITVNSLDPCGYAKITGFPGSLARVLRNIELASRKGIAMIIKANAMKTNKDQIGKIKRWAHELPGKSKENLFNFRYDTVIYPRLDGSLEPCSLRLNMRELAQVNRLDGDFVKDHKVYLKGITTSHKASRDALYFCSSFKDQFTINPFGQLKFCPHDTKFVVDLRKDSFAHGFYKVIPRLTQERFKTATPCRNCHLRTMCYSCPAAAFLENGNDEKPVKYFCRLAHSAVREARRECHKGALRR